MNRIINIVSIAILVFGLLSACTSASETKQKEARDDSAKRALALQQRALFPNTLTADAETDPVDAQLGDDAADDPAIWINPSDPEKSLILGTNKKAGIYVYNLKGEALQCILSGRINNVDLRDGFLYKGQSVALVAASNRTLNAISLYIINHQTAKLSDTIANIPSQVGDVYGICLYHNPQTNQFYAIVNGKDGQIEQWLISSNANGVMYEKVKSFAVATQPEGMVVDDSSGVLFLGVEDEGIYRHSLLSTDTSLQLLPHTSKANNKAVEYDIEGITLFKHNSQTFLLASIQGNFSYALFNVSNDCSYITSFTVTDGAVDGIEETDGLDLTTHSCGVNYPQGIIVVQDGFNKDNTVDKNQNFKIISTAKLLPLLQ